MTKTEMLEKLNDLELELSDLERSIAHACRCAEECRDNGDNDEAELYEIDRDHFVLSYNETAEEIRRLQKKMKERYC